jgi:hypothetical protein
MKQEIEILKKELEKSLNNKDQEKIFTDKLSKCEE